MSIGKSSSSLFVFAIVGAVFAHIVSPLFSRAALSARQVVLRMQEDPVVVVGGGLAGLSAAIEALRSNPVVRVVLVEKEARMGGNSAKASSGMNATPTPVQEREHIHDSLEGFLADVISSGDGRSDAELVRVLVDRSADAWNFITSFGVNLEDISQCGGHSAPRTHRNLDDPVKMPKVVNVGWSIMSTLIAHLETESKKPEDARVTIMTGSEVVRLLVSETNKVSGVELKDGQKIAASAVILTTGGFGGDLSPDAMIWKHAPELRGFATTNGGFARGDGVRMAAQVGAKMQDLDQVQIHPTGYVNPKEPGAPTKFLAPEALRAVGGILLNNNGERFVNELGTRKNVSRSMLDKCLPWDGLTGQTKASVIVFSSAAASEFGTRMLDFYSKIGLIMKAGNAAELAEKIRVPAANVERTLAEYVRSSQVGKDAFGKTVFRNPPSSTEQLFYAFVTPCIHYTMGGCKINVHAQVVREDGSPVDGLFAAGEVSAGVHGANRLAGNSLLECVVFGRIAGREATRLAASL
eukprot:ANDGO_06688.mRNA.1 Fumarate reductase